MEPQEHHIPPIPPIIPVQLRQPLSYNTFPCTFLENLTLSQDMIANIQNAQLEDDILMMLTFSISSKIHQEMFLNLMSRLKSPLSCSVPWLLTTKHVAYSTRPVLTALSIL